MDILISDVDLVDAASEMLGGLLPPPSYRQLCTQPDPCRIGVEKAIIENMPCDAVYAYFGEGLGDAGTGSVLRYSADRDTWRGHVALGSGQRSSLVRTCDALTWEYVATELLHHRIGPKDGSWMMPVRVERMRRKNANVVAFTGAVFDMDNGTPREEIVGSIVASGVAAVVLSTHSDGKEVTLLPADKVRELTEQGSSPADILVEHKKYRRDAAEGAKLGAEVVIDRRPHVEVFHRPISRTRIFVPFSSPVLASDFPDQRSFVRAWKSLYLSIAEDLGLQSCDQACSDAARLHLLPRHEPEKPFFTLELPGAFLDPRKVSIEARRMGLEANGGSTFERKAAKPTPRPVLHADRKPQPMEVGSDFDFLAWAACFAGRFEIRTLIEDRCPERLFGPGTGADWRAIECPSGAHEQNGGTGVLNASARVMGGCGVNCFHNTCGGATGSDRLELIRAMVDRHWFATSDLLGRDYYHGSDEQHAAALAGFHARATSRFDTDTIFRSPHMASSPNTLASVPEPAVASAKPGTKFSQKSKLIQAINRRCALVVVGSTTRYIFDEGDRLDIMIKQGASDLLATYKLLVPKGDDYVEEQAGFTHWLESTDRREYRGITFRPDDKAHPDFYNLWRGLALEPKFEGDCSLFKAHLLETVFSGNFKLYEWFMGWLAQLVQDPATKMGTSVIFRGEKGVGKSIVFEIIKLIFGQHAVTVSSKDQLVGKFNAHFEKAVLVGVEEGIWGGSKEADSALKHLITGKAILIERKGVDAIEVDNYTRFIFTSNAKWVVPATGDERRFFVVDVAKTRQGDKAYFKAIWQQMLTGGLERLLHELLEFDYSHLDLRQPPRTAALVGQIAQGLSNDLAWWHEMLETGELPQAPFSAREHAWKADSDLKIPVKDVQESFRSRVKGYSGSVSQGVQIGLFLKDHVPGLKKVRGAAGLNGKRDYDYIFPPLRVCRARFTDDHGIEFDAEGEAGQELAPQLRLVA